MRHDLCVIITALLFSLFLPINYVKCKLINDNTEYTSKENAAFLSYFVKTSFDIPFCGLMLELILFMILVYVETI